MGVDDGGDDAAGRGPGGLVGVAVYALYRPHGSSAAGAVAIAAGVYEFTPRRAAVDVPLALAIVVLGILIVIAPSLVPGLTR